MHQLVRFPSNAWHGPSAHARTVEDGRRLKWLATWRVPQRTLHISVEICTWIRRDAEVIAFMDWEWIRSGYGPGWSPWRISTISSRPATLGC